MSGELPRGWAAALDEHRAVVGAFADGAAAVSTERWQRPRATGKWTPAEETLHLVLAYEAALSALGGGPGIRPLVPPWRATILRWLVLPVILRLGRLPKGVRAPREIRPVPERARVSSPASLAAELRDITARAEAALARATRDGAAPRIVHPFFGGLAPLVALRFATVHTRHHLRNLPASATRGA